MVAMLIMNTVGDNDLDYTARDTIKPLDDIDAEWTQITRYHINALLLVASVAPVGCSLLASLLASRRSLHVVSVSVLK